MASTSKHAKSRKRVLGASCILAALIIGGSSFAWFTAKDEVVNKLSADLRYNVVATEDFTPPPPGEWIPGQKVTKEVKAVNTGNIDAIVASQLGFKLSVTSIGSTNTAPTASTKDDYVSVSEAEKTALTAGGNEITDHGIDGLHIFRRTDSKLVGYYQIGTEYFAVADLTYNSAATPKATVTYQTKTTTNNITGTDLTYTQKTEGGKTYLVVTYPGADAGSTTDDIVFDIELGAIGTTGDTWTHDTNSLEFYYNQLLAAGATSSAFMESVTLSNDITEGLYAGFNLDISVKVASAQVVDSETTTARVVAYNGIDTADRPAGKDAASVANSTGAGDPGQVTWAARS